MLGAHASIAGRFYQYRVLDFRLNSPTVILNFKPEGTRLIGPQVDDFKSFYGEMMFEEYFTSAAESKANFPVFKNSISFEI